MNIKNIAYCLSLWLIVLLIAACERSHPQVEAVLQQADALMEAHPDSAFSLLDSLHYHQPMSRQETARYALLLAKATNKTYHPLLPCDSLLNIALNYYNKNSPDRATALLYKGRLEEEMGQTEKAVELLQEGLSVIRDYPNEIEIKRHLLSSLGILYEDTQHYTESLSLSQELYDVCQSDKDKAIALRGISKYYAMNHQSDSALYYIGEARRLAQLSGDSASISSMEHNLALYLYYFNQSDSALHHERTALSFATNEVSRRLYYGTYGTIWYDLDNMDSAVYYLNRSMDTIVYERGRATTLLNLSQIEKYRGNLKAATSYLEQHASIIDSLYSAERDTEISNLIHEYQTELRVQAENERSRRNLYMTVLCASFLFLLVLLFYLYSINKKRKEKRLLDALLQHREKQLKVLQNLLKSDKMVLEYLENEKEQLQKDKEQLQKDKDLLSSSDEQQTERILTLKQKEKELMAKIEAHEEQIAKSKKQYQVLGNWLFTQTKSYMRVMKLRESNDKGAIDKPLNNTEKDRLQSELFSLNKPQVEELRLNNPKLKDDDILLILLQERTDMDARAIAIAMGASSLGTINTRRTRLKERYLISLSDTTVISNFEKTHINYIQHIF